jgi:hypothetical protein
MLGSNFRPRRWPTAVTLILASAISSAAHEGTSKSWLTLGSPIVVSIDPTTNSGSALLELHCSADCSATEPVSVTARDFVSSATRQPLGAKITFSETGSTTASPILTKALKPNETWWVKVDVANAWEAGESSAKLADGRSNEVGTITTVKYRFPFAVRVAGANPDKPEISLQRGHQGFLGLKNDDPLFYVISWQLAVGDKPASSSGVELSHNGSNSVAFEPPDEWFTGPVSGLFKDQDRDADLILKYGSALKSEGRFSPTKNITVKLHLRYWPGWVQQIFGNGILFLVLLLGGASSLVVSFGISNKLKQLSLRDKIRSASARISGVSTSIDSRLRVLLRVERNKWKRELHCPWYLPDSLDVLSQCGDGIAALSNRVGLAERLDELRHRYEDLAAQGLPPTYIDQADQTLQAASDALRQSQASADAMATTKSLLDKAESLLKTQGQDPSFAQELANRVKKLNATNESLKGSDVCKKMTAHFPGAFRVLADSDNLDPSKILPQDYRLLDAATFKLQMAFDYSQLYQGTAAGSEYRKRLEAREEKFLSNLEADAWDHLRAARLVLREMVDNVYPEDLKEALEAVPQAASIEMDRAVARQNEPLELYVHFHNPAFDHAPARDEWVCNWTFHNNLYEKWWSVWHYFPKKGQTEVTVTFEDANGRLVTDAKSNCLTLSRAISVEPEARTRSRERFVTEGLRSGIALFAAILGLVAGARDQFLKLDLVPALIAVFSAGFAADTIKNLITQAPAGKKTS